MGHEPSGFVGHAQHTAQLVAGNAFLGRAKQVVGVQPGIQGNLGVLVDGAHGHAKGLLTGVAPVDARTGRLALEGRGLVQNATMGARAAIGPKQRLKVLAGGGGVGEADGHFRWHWRSFLSAQLI